MSTAVQGARHDAKVIGLIGSAHFVSHYYILLLAPILGVVKDYFGIDYVALGLAITVFNLVSAFLQTPAGFLVDRFGPRLLLTGGLLIGAGAIALAALVPNYWVFVFAFGLLGLANTVYHPADYSILSHAIGGKRIGKAFSIHTFCGYMGGAVAPLGVVASAELWGWQGAFLMASALGVAAALLLIAKGAILDRPVANHGADAVESAGATKAAPSAAPTAQAKKDGWALLLSKPILLNLFFFVLLALSNGGVQNYSVVALGALHGTAVTVANFALSGFLLMSALGVLLGGWIADRTRHHERVAAICFMVTSSAIALICWIDLGTALLVLVMGAGGLLNGVIQPSRDMIVRSATPPGSFGKVFGFVSTGFNIGGVVTPVLYGAMMDAGRPEWIFISVIVFILLSLVTVITRKRPEQPFHAATQPAE
ncbi:MAG: MFS transporter [Rhodospirillales bacterium]